MIHVIAVIRAVPGQRDTLLAEFRKIVPGVLSKVGCIEYSLAVHLQSEFPGQRPFDENELLIVEKWTGLDALRSHITDQAYQAWFVKIWMLVADASMQILEAAD